MKYLLLIILLIPALLSAEVVEHKAKGFHWYSEDEVEPKVKAPSEVAPAKPALEPYQELLLKRRETLNLLAESILRPSTQSTKAYIEAQQKMAKRHQQFVQNWARVLLTNPELDHRLNFPTDNNAIAIKNEEDNALTEAIIKDSAEKFGLIFIYQGKSQLSQRFSKILQPFIDEHHFAIIPVSVDGVDLTEFKDTRHINIEAVSSKFPVKKQYLPALFLVNLKTQELSQLSYGFVALSDLKHRILDVVTDFKRFSYSGLGG